MSYADGLKTPMHFADTPNLPPGSMTKNMAGVKKPSQSNPGMMQKARGTAKRRRKG